MRIDKGRIGQFFFFMGLLFFIFLLGADQLDRAELSIFCLSMSAFLVAFYFFWKDWKAPSGSGRFRALRKMTQKKPEDKKS